MDLWSPPSLPQYQGICGTSAETAAWKGLFSRNLIYVRVNFLIATLKQLNTDRQTGSIVTSLWLYGSLHKILGVWYG